MMKRFLTVLNRSFLPAFFLFVMMFVAGYAAEAQSKATLHHRVSSQEGIAVGITISPDPEWHVYWRYPGDSGARLKTNWGCDGMSPAGKSESNPVEPIAWPIPEVIAVGPLVNYGYGHPITLEFNLDCDRAKTTRVMLEAEWLVCKEECVPQFASLELMPPFNGQGGESAAVDTKTGRAAHWPSTTVRALQGVGNAEFTKAIIPLTEAERLAQGIRFIPETVGQIINAAPQGVSDAGLTVMLASPAPKNLSGLLVVSQSEATPITVAVTTPPMQTSELLPILFAAFLGGVLLNVMPCVFPVLGLKIYQLVSAEPAERKLNSILYAVGVCISMLALGSGIGLLRASGLGVGWGTQLQNPIVVYSLALLFVLLGCNLLGMFELGGSIQAAAGKVKAAGPLMDGLLTVLVATPCTAPFMAGAVAVAFTLPIASQLLIFFFLGLGVATPVLIVGVVPAFARILPRPGAWMDLAKQFLAWPLFGSAAWLLTVLVALVGLERATAPIFGVVMLGFLVWAFCAIHPVGIRKALFVIASVVILGWFYPTPKDAQYLKAITHVVYSKSELARLRAAGTPVFLDATATWCITCQSNKRLVLHTDSISKELAARKVVWMEADWTEPNEEITNLLTEFQRAGVPLNVYFPPHKEPIVFPPILTSSMVLEALAR